MPAKTIPETLPKSADTEDYLPRLIEEQCRRTPEAVAVVCENEQISYAELNHRANQWAHSMRKLGVAAEERVGICAERSVDTVAGLLGILKAGGAYVPLDPDYPSERLAWMLEDAQVKILMLQGHLLERLPSRLPPSLFLDHVPETSRDESEQNVACRLFADNAAYLIYTSGSTGRPKGVVNTHGGIRNRLLWMQAAYGLDATDRVLQKTPFSFDVSVWELFWPLMCGACLVMARPEGHRESRYLTKTISEQKITTIHFVPSMLTHFLDDPWASECSGLRRVFCSGEALSADLVNKFQAKLPAMLHNLYGPTEAAIDVTAWECPRGIHKDPVPIGRPIANTRIYVLDSEMNPAPAGVEGELYIAGAGLARGYVNRPDLTAERFVPASLEGEEGTRLYRTGDIGRSIGEATIEFLGRTDNQVKIRGFRIELDEIGTVLRSHPEVKDAVVAAHERDTGEKQLVGYIVPKPASAPYVLGDYSLPNGMRIVQQNPNETDYLYREIFESQVYWRHGIGLPPNGCVFDVGANIGIFSLFIAHRAPGARIYAFEPIPRLFKILQTNAESCPAITKAFNFGLSDQEGADDFTYYPRNTIMSGRKSYVCHEQNASVLTQYIRNEQMRLHLQDDSFRPVDELLAGRLEEETYRCRLKRLSDVMREESIDRIDLLKIDVEGGELDVLAGLDPDDWRKIDQIVVETQDGPHSTGRMAQLRELLSVWEYEVIAEEEEESLKGTGLCNIYAIRRTATKYHNKNEPTESKQELAAGRAPLSIDSMRDYLQHKLPEYMLPSAYVFLSSFPLTTSGKLDRKALPRPQDARPDVSQLYIAPHTPLERNLSRIWAEVLHVDRVGIHDNFLHLGGHSLLAAGIIARIRETYGIYVSLQEFLSLRTVANQAAFISTSQQGQDTAVPSIAAVPRTQDLPIGFSQERVWFLLRFEPSSIAYHFQGSLRIRGSLDVDALQSSLTEMVRRHEILRTTFVEKEGSLVQRIHQAEPLSLPVIIVSKDEKADSPGILQLIQRETSKTFDISRLPLVRWILFRLDEQEHLLLDIEHHFTHDGWGFNVFIGELLTIYKACRSGKPSPLAPPAIQFADFAYWQQQFVVSEAIRRQAAYWKTQLAGVQPITAFPADFPRPPVQTFEGALLRIRLPLGLSREVRMLARRENTSLFVTMMAAFFCLIHRYTRQDDLCVGSTVANRNHPGTEGLLGMLVNNLALRAQLPPRANFRHFLAQVNRVTLEAYENQDIPFHHVVQNAGLNRDLSTNPLFQLMFNFHNSPISIPEFRDLTFELTEGIGNGSAKFDIGVIVIPSFEQRLQLNPDWDKDDLTMLWEYNTALFEEATVRRIVRHYQLLLKTLAGQETAEIAEICLMAEEEKQQVKSWSQGPGNNLPCGCVHQLIERQAARTPMATAVQYANEAISYEALNRRANQLARYLRRHNVTTERLVGVCIERSIDLMVTLIAVMKAGGAYVPLDPGFPTDRLSYMAEDARLEIVIVEGGETRRIFNNARVINLSEAAREIASEAGDSLENFAYPETLAYVIYTSGSTGKPKGVMIQHRSLANILESFRKEPGITREDTLLATTTLSFDISALELFGPLLSGGRVRIAPSVQNGVDDLISGISANNVSVLQATPTLWNVLAAAPQGSFPENFKVLCGGEAMERTLAERLQQTGSTVWNLYGPTETTVWSAIHRVRYSDSRTIPIGRPISNTQIHILDDSMQLTPVGVAGNVYIGGAGLARGYLERAALTAERFVPNPLATESGERLYQTGDIARWRSDGHLEFLGRADHQVKLRGHRIELGEIEAILEEYLPVAKAIVNIVTTRDAEKRLVAYFVAQSDTEAIDVALLRAHLYRVLPAYMVPAFLVQMEQFPLTPNGKIDRKALPIPEPRQERSRTPRTEQEKELCRIIAEVLSLEQVSIDDNFFALGGHSLMAMQVVSRVRAVLGAVLTVRMIFEAPTVAEMSLLLASGHAPLNAVKKYANPSAIRM